MNTARTSTLLIVLALATASCGDDDTVSTTAGPVVTSLVTTTSPAPVPTTHVITPTTGTDATTTTTAPPTTTTIPGAPYDIYPPERAVLAVVGVAHDDTLDVRILPGITAIVTTLEPLHATVVSAGEGRQVERTIWWKVVANGETGWVNAGYLAYLGAVDDLTSLVVESHGGYPSAPTMSELGWIVAERFASEDPPSRIVLSAAPKDGDLGEVAYDVIGLGDDSVAGYRLHVFGMSDAGGFTLKSVEATVLCYRGVTDGVCV